MKQKYQKVSQGQVFGVSFPFPRWMRVATSFLFAAFGGRHGIK
jgi:hypothetical protein